MKVINNTICCKMEHNKFFYMINLEALFAEYLVSLKTKPFTGAGARKMFVGSLLTPIFTHLGISTVGYTVNYKEGALDDIGDDASHTPENAPREFA